MLELSISVYPMLALGVTGKHRVALIISVYTFLHTLAQLAVVILGQQAVPTAAPDNFDYVPVRAPESALQFLNNFPVATHWPVESL